MFFLCFNYSDISILLPFKLLGFFSKRELMSKQLRRKLCNFSAEKMSKKQSRWSIAGASTSASWQYSGAAGSRCPSQVRSSAFIYWNSSLDSGSSVGTKHRVYFGISWEEQPGTPSAKCCLVGTWHLEEGGSYHLVRAPGQAGVRIVLDSP